MSELESHLIRILVVDDEDIVISLVRDALEDDGYEVETASCGHDALQMAELEPFDLLITDIRMPEMSGIELAGKARDRHSDTAVIFMTGYADLNSAKEAIKHGAVAYILKPFELNEIRQAVRNAIHAIEQKKERTSAEQLDSLTGMSQVLLSTDDRKSLIPYTLQFVMMHCKARGGAMISWDKERTEVRLVTVTGDSVTEKELPPQMLGVLPENAGSSLPAEPLLMRSLDEYPFCSENCLEEWRNSIPDWLEQDESMVVAPVRRASQIYGLLMVGPYSEPSQVRESHMKFITLTAGQLAMSLENLRLLEDAKNAYDRLKALQDETIELEKMATRGEMSAEIGHELNNFLAVVAGNLSLLESRISNNDTNDIGRFVRTAIETVDKIRVFTTNLMDLRQVTSTKETVLFDRLLADVLDFLKPQKRFHGVNTTVNVNTRDISFQANPIQIQQLLYNLFNNAADATRDRDDRQITVSLEQNAQGTAFTFTIRDNGVGIKPALLKKAFSEKFTTKKDGHGYGLMVCKRIIDSHGGQLHIDSESNVGTVISIDFPMAMSQTPALVPAQA
ncbi:MAG: response regulator [Candidatus Zixiibacteriota bacterium]